MHQAGVSVRGKAVRERDAGAFEDHIVRWPGQPPRGKRAKPPTDKEKRGERGPMKNALFGGVNAAVLTAMQADLSPDPARMAGHAKWLLANGCNGLGVLGTTGEANSFGLHERRRSSKG